MKKRYAAKIQTRRRKFRVLVSNKAKFKVPNLISGGIGRPKIGVRAVKSVRISGVKILK